MCVGGGGGGGGGVDANGENLQGHLIDNQICPNLNILLLFVLYTTRLYTTYFKVYESLLFREKTKNTKKKKKTHTKKS